MRRMFGAMRAGAAAVALLALAACAGTQTVAPPSLPPQGPVVEAPQTIAPPPAVLAPVDDRVRVALLVPLTGRGAAVGQAMLEAAQMAVFELADERFVLLPRDTGGTPEGAEAAMRDAVAAGARLVLGPLFGADAQAVRPVAQMAGIPVLSFSNDTGVAGGVAGGNVWILGFQPRDQVARVMRFAAGKGLASYGILAPAGAYGDAVVETMTAVAAETGARIAAVERYSPGESDLADVVKRFAAFDTRQAALEQERATLSARDDDASRLALRRLANQQTFGELPFQAAMVADGGSQLRGLAPLFPFFDLDPGPVKLLGTGLWDEPGLGREPALVGGWFAAPAPEARQEFEQRFEALHGRRPPRLATLAYDATALAAVLARSGDPQPFEPADLMNPNGFFGIDGIFRLLPNGLAERGLAVVEVTRSGFLVIDPAPQTFQPQVF